jgi:hypothetical protein
MLKTVKIMDAPPETPPDSEEFVRNAIEIHRVCYERWNEFEMVNGVRTHTGYSLRLCGINRHDGDGSGGHPVPGCPICRDTYDDLRRVAGWILPKDVRKSRYKIEPFDYALHIAPKARGYREEIVVTIQILHRFNPYFPADECESLCLKEMCGKLKEFGVLEGRVKSGCGENG